jgi:hypothetical protein
MVGIALRSFPSGMAKITKPLLRTFVLCQLILPRSGYDTGFPSFGIPERCWRVGSRRHRFELIRKRQAEQKHRTMVQLALSSDASSVGQDNVFRDGQP